MTGTARTASPSSRTRTSLGTLCGTGTTGTVTARLDTFARRRLFKSNVIYFQQNQIYNFYNVQPLTLMWSRRKGLMSIFQNKMISLLSFVTYGCFCSVSGIT